MRLAISVCWNLTFPRGADWIPTALPSPSGKQVLPAPQMTERRIVGEVQMNRSHRYKTLFDGLLVRVLSRLPVHSTAPDPVVFLPSGIGFFDDRVRIKDPFAQAGDAHSTHGHDRKVRHIDIEECILGQSKSLDVASQSGGQPARRLDM